MARPSELRYTKVLGYYSTINKRRFYFGRDERKARIAFTEKLAQHNRGEIIANPLVSTVIADFLAYKEATVSEGTLQWYTYPCQSFANYIGPKTKVGSLGPSDLEVFVAKHWKKKRGGKLADNTKRQALRAVKTAFIWASENRRIGFNPFKTVKVGQYSPAKILPTDAQLTALLEHFKDDEDLTDFISFSAITGARVNEVRNILCNQVDLETGEIVLTEEQTKSYEQQKDKNVRTIILSPPAIEIVKRNLEKNKEGLLFQNQKGLQSDSQWTTGAIRSRFTRAKKHLKFYITPRSLRHYFATKFLLNGGNPVSGSILLGHQSTNMLLRNYQKLIQEKSHLKEQANIVQPIAIKTAQ